MPSSWAVRKMRIAISLRLAARSLPIAFGPASVMVPLRAGSHLLPQFRDVPTLRLQPADGDAHHPPAVQQRRREIRLSRSVEALHPPQRVPIERLTLHVNRLVAKAHGL